MKREAMSDVAKTLARESPAATMCCGVKQAKEGRIATTLAKAIKFPDETVKKRYRRKRA